MTGHIRRRGANSWELKFDIGVDEKTGRRRIRYHTFRGSKRDANLRLAELLTQHSKGAYVDKSKVTVAQHVAARIDQWEGAGEISAKTAERYRELMDNQIRPHLGDRPIQKLKVIDVETWQSDLRRRGRKDGKGGLSNRTIGHAHRVLSQALKDGARFDLVVKNVAAEQGAPAIGDDDEEVTILKNDRVREAINGLRGRAMFPKFVLVLFTGIRRGELLAVRWRNLDIDNAKVLSIREALEETRAHGIRFKRPKTKNGTRDISLPDIVVEALREYRREQLELRLRLGLGKLPDDALVFPTLNGGPSSPRAFSAYWSEHAAQLGMPDITLHALRHTHASQLIDAGIDVVTISKRLGHSNPSVTLRIYAHLFRKRDDKAAAAINDALAGFGVS